MALALPTTMIEVPEGQEWIIDMVTNILVEVLASIVEQERQTIRRQQREGIDVAKKRGVLAKMIGSRVDICENECGYASDGIPAMW